MSSKRIFDLENAASLTGTEIFEAEQDGSEDSVKVTTQQIIDATKLVLSGSGKQFDADLLDGQHGTYYLNASNISSCTLSPSVGGTGVSAFTPNTFFYASSANSINFLTPTQARTQIQAEPVVAAGTTSQYYRGDKTWRTLDKNAVGLSFVDNTSDLNKPISTATQDALNPKIYKMIDSGAEDIGFIADEVEKVYPHAVKTVNIKGDNYKAIAYDKLTVILASQLNEALKRIDILEKKLG